MTSKTKMAAPTLEYERTHDAARKAPLWHWIVLVAFAVAMFAAAISVMVPKFGSDPIAARFAAAKTDLVAIGAGMNAFRLDVGRWPSTAEGLDALVAQPAQAAGWRGPYLKRPTRPNDPWGQPYLYERTVSHAVIGFKLTCGGPDGRIGTSDDLNFTAP